MRSAFGALLMGAGTLSGRNQGSDVGKLPVGSARQVEVIPARKDAAASHFLVFPMRMLSLNFSKCLAIGYTVQLLSSIIAKNAKTPYKSVEACVLNLEIAGLTA
jgi:hypothetical protein